MFTYFRKKLFEEIPIYSLVFTRIAFGAVMIYQFFFKYILMPERLINHYVEERFRFKFYGFEWVQPMSQEYTFLLFYAMSVLSLFIMVGAFYRISIILFTLGFTYIFLIDKALYLNHFYLAILYSFLMCFVPGHRYFSVDAYLRPKIKTTYVHFWPLFLLRTQTEIVLLYAGLVKINYDWLMRAMPLKLWLARGSSFDFLDYLFHLQYAPFIASWGTVILHIFGAPLLLWKRTRIYVFIVYCLFHLVNNLTFKIGIFPAMTIAFTLIFFNPDWPMKFFQIPYKAKEKSLAAVKKSHKDFIICLILLWSIVQILFPLRSLLYPGNVLWTQQGHDFSWRMKLQDTVGNTVFVVTDLDSNETWDVPFRSRKIIHCRPDMILQFAHYLRDSWHEKGYKNVAVHVRSRCGLNGREPILFINPAVDLAKEKRSLKHKEWIMPFSNDMK